jgi:hypothetical protein
MVLTKLFDWKDLMIRFHARDLKKCPYAATYSLYVLFSFIIFVCSLTFDTFLKELKKLGITTICIGQHHTLGMTASGAVYAWGKGDYGQLGLGQENGANPRFKYTQSLLTSCVHGFKCVCNNFQ